jgi:hypothetical protein
MGPTPKCHFVMRHPNGSPEILTTRPPIILGPITLCVNLRLKWGLKQSCRELSNGMLHTTCTQGNWGDFWLFVVRSQIANLIRDPFFGYYLCVKCPNGSCKPILNIYFPRAFQWYKKLLNLMGFDLYNYSLKIWESTRTPIPKVGAHLGVWNVTHAFLGTWNVTLELHTWPAPSQALVLVANPRLGLRHFPPLKEEVSVLIDT